MMGETAAGQRVALPEQLAQLLTAAGQLAECEIPAEGERVALVDLLAQLLKAAEQSPEAQPGG